MSCSYSYSYFTLLFFHNTAIVFMENLKELSILSLSLSLLMLLLRKMVSITRAYGHSWGLIVSQSRVRQQRSQESRMEGFI